MRHRTITHRFAAAMAILALALASCASTGTAAPELVPPAQAAQVLEDLGANVVLLDVRTPEEFNEARVPGSINIDYYATDFADRLAELAKDVPYVVYCRSGNRSAETMGIMAGLGFEEVYEVEGGILAWGAAGLPLEN